MHVVIVGGHARTALVLARLLVEAGHEVTGTVRDPAQGPELSAIGVRFAVADLEHAATNALVRLPAGCDAVVYAAGAGYGRVRIGEGLTGGTLPRADLAALLTRVLVRGDGVRRQFDVTGGDQDLATVPL